MSCSLSKSFTLGCKEYAGGVEEFKIVAMPSGGFTVSDFTIGTGNTVTVGVGSQTIGWKKYQIRQEVASLVETTNTDPKTAVLWYQKEFKFSLENFNAADSLELNNLAKNKLLLAIKTVTGKIFLVGLFKGADVTAQNSQTGMAFGDKYGYDVTIIYKDIHPIYEISASDYALLS